MAIYREVISGDIDLDLLPLEFEFSTSEMGLPFPAFEAPALSDATAFGIEITWICPGFPACGKEDSACSEVVKSPVVTIPLPPLPSFLPVLPTLPKWDFSVTVPSSAVNPKKCPQYNKKAV